MHSSFAKIVLGLVSAVYLCLQLQDPAAQKGAPTAAQPTLEGPAQNPGAPLESRSWNLSGLVEPPLAGPTAGPEVHAYRLILIGFPSAKIAILRLEIQPDGSGKLFVKQTKFGQTEVLFSKEVSVPVEGVDGFLACVARANFWTLPYKEVPEPWVVDGTYWYFEGARGSVYHLVYRREPEDNPGPFTAIGRYLGKDLAQLPDSVISVPPWEPPVLVRRKPRG